MSTKKPIAAWVTANIGLIYNSAKRLYRSRILLNNERFEAPYTVEMLLHPLEILRRTAVVAISNVVFVVLKPFKMYNGPDTRL